METIFFMLAGIFIGYEISKRNPTGLSDDGRKDLAFFYNLLDEGKNLSMGQYPYIYEYEYEYDDLGHPKKLKRFGRYTTTKEVYKLLEKTTPALNFFMQDTNEIDKQWLSH